MAAVPVGKGMNLGDELVMEANQTFVDREGLFVEPVLRVPKQLWNALRDFPWVAANVQFMSSVGPGPLPYLVEHFRVQCPEIGFFQGICGIHGSTAEGPLVGLQNIKRLVLVEFAHGADFRNQLLGFFGADWGVPIGVLVIEDEVHFVLPRRKRR